MVFFPEALQKILMFLPFQYAVYVPIRVFIGTYEIAGNQISIPGIVGLQAIMCLIMLILSEVMYRTGIKRFTGVGV